METLHKDHMNWSSDCEFIRDELHFFDHLLGKVTNVINAQIDLEISNGMSAYAIEFNQKRHELEQLQTAIDFHEGILKDAINDDSLENDLMKEHQLLKVHHEKFMLGYKQSKSNFYDFMKSTHQVYTL